jgi:hypothetical protein
LSCPEVVPENTVIFGSKCSRRQQADRPPVSLSAVSSNTSTVCLIFVIH